ncbi:hypothetical protein K469DRAFT_17491 [Zopfia rhizophila CBS 207.26]|uniref:DUF7708 domain-containing protein n=1 Tax=Zopfia rhizophila CBS 207.26 TaxID=1314779 RepID=A0A6A6EY80_9PEZI|nr:hypothetical protein K469DRAFT_17491 [Zopfia rhizophila CBS 207.26]
MASMRGTEDDASITIYRAMIRSHYAPDADWRDIAQEAYVAARVLIETELKGSKEARAIISGQGHTIDDVRAIVEQAKRHYDAKSQDRTKVLKYLEECSIRITYYGSVLDVLAQHHAEYVALAWGALKFILLGIIEHRRLIQEFSQALVQIGDALRQTKLTVELYQTEDIRDATSRLYKHVLLFFAQAIKWYNRSPLGRAFSAAFTPYELKYKDTVEQIKLYSRTIKDIAVAKSQAELRDMHISIKLMQQDHLQIKETASNILRVATCNKTITERIGVSVHDMLPCTRDIQLSHILSALKPQICPHETLRTTQSIVMRSRSTKLSEAEPRDVLHSLNRWFSKEGSSLFVLRVGPRAEPKARELTTDIITLLRKKELNVIWRLSPPHGSSASTQQSIGEVLKVLIHQVLTIQSSILQPQDFNIAKFRAIRSDAEWVALFRQLFFRLSKCYIIMEMHDLFQANEENVEWMSSFLNLFQELTSEATSKGNALKFLVLCYGSRTGDVSNVGDIVTVLRRPPVIPASRKKVVAHKRGPKGWERVQPKL